ncbi:2C-methyl-D-erythritol 2,4-cyclodiphosphate synthase [Thermocrinis albus DSM 14484]|uniref:2-C-methyl-D-erythritol 2,4-cyclodiphosphate synthase n=1 Tax=Thermocrinis albus (strain DSM 14484 / JCM 11386 / HI 11/12) TaxID=638303 RepID=D3SLL5_THEAH|nr:2-C-methyl-D-erythritol 2,4-cyclodiphosphate synthase [Thermocrinis albus]ADC89645.1 2C-methyl-D-erythritol 2,4-cyclodiphosphate synthase [Thermocrinis albus DSM 14484]
MIEDIRIGLGFDGHRLEEGLELKLGGVKIDYPKGLKGHSDGDVLLHALTDALLSACKEPDIGQLFPDTDPMWKGADSRVFLMEALKRVKEKGYMIMNVDCTVVADEPRIAPYRKLIEENIAQLMELDPCRVSVKGKTREGFCKDDSVACFCVVLLVKA